MARVYISQAIQDRVAESGNHRCGYCLTPQSFTAMPMHVEHIIPMAAGGPSIEDNLWLACPLCNNYKGVQTHASDPETRQQVALYNPRLDSWQDHFSWSEDGTEVVGLTSTGRATVIALKLNNRFLVNARRRWVSVGWHPPED